MGKIIFKEGQFPDDNLIFSMLKKYYFPYHKKLEAVAKDKKIKLALDCHSMLDKSPPISKKQRVKRPLFCLSNLGNSTDEITNTKKNITCSFSWIHRLAECFINEFGIDKKDIKINHPFKGGYILQLHGRSSIPWIQVEINRILYLAGNDSDNGSIHKSEGTIRYVQKKLLTILESFFSQI
jgi:formiminoglutamase